MWTRLEAEAGMFVKEQPDGDQVHMGMVVKGRFEKVVGMFVKEQADRDQVKEWFEEEVGMAVKDSLLEDMARENWQMIEYQQYYEDRITKQKKQEGKWDKVMGLLNNQEEEEEDKGHLEMEQHSS